MSKQNPEKLYIIRDISNDEYFYNRAYFLRKEEALKCINENGYELGCSYEQEAGRVELQLDECEFGIDNDNYKTICKVVYSGSWDEEKDSLVWAIEDTLLQKKVGENEKSNG